MRRVGYFRAKLLISGLFALSLTGCPGENKPDAIHVDAVPKCSYNKFTSVWNTVFQVYCVSCHGVFQNPKFADPNPETAYNAVIGVIDQLDERAQNGHCNNNSLCAHAPGSAVVAEIQDFQSKYSNGCQDDSPPVVCNPPIQGAASPIQVGDYELNLSSLIGEAILIRFTIIQVSPGAPFYRVNSIAIVNNTTGEVTLNGAQLFVENGTDSTAFPDTAIAVGASYTHPAPMYIVNPGSSIVFKALGIKVDANQVMTCEAFRVPKL